MGELYYGKPLTARVTSGKVVIEIGVETLAHAASYAEWANRYDAESGDYLRDFAITDPSVFAKEVVRAMLDERENGSSPLSDFLDKAMQDALDDGADGVEPDQRILTGKFSPLETWAKQAQR